ncbi:MAG TPA: hypothetical protein VG756_27965 [Pseudonocardiaceae bacterium]|jgi:hypothetical protein|nr:hypothetical protein [Pseudonocardiaceae bacterium]
MPWSVVRVSVDHVWDENKVDSTGFEFSVPIDGIPDTPALAITPDLASHKLMCVLTAKTAGGSVELPTGQV